MTSWSKKQYRKEERARVKTRVPPVFRNEEIRKAEEKEFQLEVKEIDDVDIRRTEGEDR